MTRKVQIVRFWLVCIAALACLCLIRDPAFALIPVLFFPGQAGCFCCAGAADCIACTVGTTHLTYEVVISGVADGSCGDCESLNATYVVSQDVPISNCHFAYIFSPDICLYSKIDLQISTAVLLGFRAQVAIRPVPDNGNSFGAVSSDFSQADCHFSGHVVDSQIQVDPTDDCDGTAMTCTVTAL